MEPIRKRICIDNSRSHTTGLLPYIYFDGDDDGVIHFVDSSDASGNWGHYVCDIVSSDGERLKYCDVINHYYFIQDKLRDGQYCKAVKGDKMALTTKLLDGCEIEVKNKYDFEMLDTTKFTTDGEGKFVPISDEVVVEDGKYYVLLADFDVIKGYVNEWEKWKNVLGPHTTFCQDVEEYIIGKYLVPAEIMGVRVPEYVYAVDVNEYKDWFAKREGERDTDTEQEWEDYGGDLFKAFIDTIEPKWRTSVDIEDGYTFVAPYIPLHMALNQEYEIGGTYEPYLYSITSDELMVEAYKPYEAPSFSAFTSSGLVESKLSYVMEESAVNLDGVIGCWKTFERAKEDDDKTNIFKCEFHSASSSLPGRAIIEYKKYDDGEIVSSFIAGPTQERPPITQSDAERVVVMSQTYKGASVSAETEVTAEELENGVVSKWVTTAATVYDYTWWECSRLTKAESKELICADGEEIQSGELKYRSVTVLDSFKYMGLSGGTYYFMAKYNNGPRFNGEYISHDEGSENEEGTVQYKSGKGQLILKGGVAIETFGIPFKEGTFHNMYSKGDGSNLFVGDYITKIKETDNSYIDIYYTIGGDAEYDRESNTFTAISGTGIEYLEQLPYSKANEMLVFMDGNEGVTIYYDSIDLSENDEAVSEDFGLSRGVRRATLVNMPVGTTLNTENAITAMLFTREGSDAFIEDPKKNIDIVFDRGAAAAFEHHFKLSECNTYEDLENYGNNYFNLKDTNE